MSGWTALAGAAAVVAVAATREYLRWRGRRWRGSGPRGDQPRGDGSR
jgi:hypothetical protein